MTTQDTKPSDILEDLYPGQTPEWYAEEKEHLDEYLALIVRIYERISADPETLAKFRSHLAAPPEPSIHDTFDNYAERRIIKGQPLIECPPATTKCREIRRRYL